MGGRRGKKRGYNSQEPIKRIKMPSRRKGEMFARVTDIYGQERMEVFCEDGEHRIGRVRGKIKKRVWIRQGDLVIVNPWDFETKVEGKKGKCEIFWRYYKREISWLERKRRLPEIMQINNIPF
ncbi:MAG: translation initiation factor eIF-1A [Candidatus Lokiarchaeota archaeon]|nr:translation initiation factor eIF-1A [Candidatus Lokiarchaeota archaeon]MBD3341289.1 translation initiation factor eIF-1A [Candidatus Lokiarchaeota archaeon]